ncbi:MAG: hypothetical protein SO161_04990 [Treponema sp.]|nr:hypothetical protein [Treponema sp.]
MTVNKLTRTLKAKGYEMDRYTINHVLTKGVVTYTEWNKEGKTAIELERRKDSGKTEVTGIHKDFKDEFKEMGIYLGTILK